LARLLENENTRLVLGGELNNAAAHQVRDLFVNVPDFGPEVGIVLFVLGNDARLRSVACNTSKQFLPTARYRCAIPNEGSSQDGAVNGLDAAHS
jgi:hypothetical protein